VRNVPEYTLAIDLFMLGEREVFKEREEWKGFRVRVKVTVNKGYV
jgi:hypothetical protein